MSDKQDVVKSATKEWFIYVVDHHEGPYSHAEIQARIAEGSILNTTFLWKEGFADWVLGEDLQDFKNDFRASKPLVLKNLTDLSVEPTSTSQTNNSFHKPSNEGKTSVFKKLSLTFIVVVGFLGLYQATVTHVLDDSLRKIGLTSAVEAIHRAQLPVLPVPASLPRLDAVTQYLPESIRSRLTRLTVPEGLSLNSLEDLKKAAGMPLSNGAAFSIELVGDQKSEPKFFIATNLPDQTNVTIALRGVPGTLVGVKDYTQAQTLTVVGHGALSNVFRGANGETIPYGDYVLVVFDSPEQSEVVAEKLKDIPKADVPKDFASILGAQRVLFYSKYVFLGGEKDDVYAAKKKAYEEQLAAERLRVWTQIDDARQQLRELVDNSAALYFKLNKKRTAPASKKAWAADRTGYEAASVRLKQLGSDLVKREPSFAREVGLLGSVIQTADALNQLENGAMNGEKVSLDQIRAQANKVADAFKQLEEALQQVKPQVATSSEATSADTGSADSAEGEP